MHRSQQRSKGPFFLLVAMLLVLSGPGCEGGFVGGGECAGPGCGSQPAPGPEPDPFDPPPGQPPAAPPKNPAQTCAKDVDCTSPYVCNVKAGKCVPPSAKDNGTCDPIEGKGCEGALECVNGVCQAPPGVCADNGGCPAGYICQSGVCAPDGGGAPGCLDNTQCPVGQVCVAGQCKPQQVCTIPHSDTRLAGTWDFDSTLQVRDGLQGFTKGLLGAATTLQNIIDGKFKIKGIPGIFSSLIGGIVKSLIVQYVPAWGTEAIGWLADVDSALQQWRVKSLEVLQALGKDQYVGHSLWTLVEFQYKGAKVSASPANIPGVGEVKVKGYTAREVCGTLIIDKHAVKSKIGEIFRWAIEALLTTISCTRSDIPCFKSIDQLVNALIDCPALGSAVASADSTIPGISVLVAGACAAEKQNLIKLIVSELNNLSLNLTTMSLAAKADIANTSNQLANGRWYGVLGGALGKGNFEGSFTAFKK